MSEPAAPLRILWAVQGVRPDGEGGWTASLASSRYRATLPAEELAAMGHEIEFVEPAQCRWPPAKRADVLVLGKLLQGPRAQDFQPASDQLLAVARAAVAYGVAVIADFNDDYFDHALMGTHWRSLAQAATLCVAGSDAMAATVARFTGRPVAVVGDPVASPGDVARVFRQAGGVSRLLCKLTGAARNGSVLRMAWFGSPAEWPAMERWAERLAPLAAQQRFILRAATRAAPQVESFISRFNARHGPDAALELVPGDEDTQWSVVHDADLVLLPAGGARLAEVLHCGRCVIASTLPPQAPFASFVTATDDPLQACRDYLADPDAHLEKVAQGRKAALLAASPEVIAQRWLDAIEQARKTPPPLPQAAARQAEAAGAGPADAPIRLNLGCGDKVLPGYVNVDVVASRRGRAPDVLCDLHDLSSVFADGHADEVMAVHVVEHFWRWEVEAVLREWVRVLKPGGRMVLECPNLISACEAFLRDPERLSEPDQRGQQTMWVFYGDPAWKDPYMIHRWGYTPTSLARLMESVGLVNVRQEPAQYKLREPRDMRVVGEKPPA